MGAEEKTRVIIVDDIAETRENIRKLLQFEADVDVIGAARTGKEACDLSKELKPDVVLMDINMPDMDGITATENIRRLVPFAQIIILSVQNDASYMRRAMLAGARDFLTKPPSIDDLTSAIRRAGVMAREEKSKSQKGQGPQLSGPGITAQTSAIESSGKIIVVYSPKGGTGCTTVATNIAVALNNEETPLVLVDGNLQFGDVAVFLNEQGKNSIVDLAPRADELDPEIVEGVLLTHSVSGIKVLPAPHRPEHSESVTGDQFVKVLNFLRRMYSYVVVDTSSTLTDSTLGAIQDAADLIILITTQEIPSIKNARLFLDLTNALGVQRRRVLFVMNKFDKRIGITPEKVSESFKLDFAAVIPFDERTVVPSVNRGVPFFLGDKSKPVSRSIVSLTEAIRQRFAEIDSKEDVVEMVRLGGIKGKK
ncbi:MAG: response regulator [Omnitrophica WOR_2 bacterium]